MLPILLTLLKIIIFIVVLLIVLGVILYYVDRKLFKKTARWIVFFVFGSDKRKGVEKTGQKVESGQKVEDVLNQQEKLSLVDIRRIVKEEVLEDFKTIIQGEQLRKQSLDKIQGDISELKRLINFNINQLDQLQKSMQSAQSRQASRVELQRINANEVFYAKMVDCDSPYGFCVANLLRTKNGCCFKITTSNYNKAEYEVVDDAAIHQEMLAAFDPIITNSSSFDSTPQGAIGMQTIRKGVLVLEEGVWRIVNKQFVKFV